MSGASFLIFWGAADSATNYVETSWEGLSFEFILCISSAISLCPAVFPVTENDRFYSIARSSCARSSICSCPGR